MNQQENYQEIASIIDFFPDTVYCLEDGNGINELKYLGQNNKRILIVTKHPKEEFLSEKEYLLFVKGSAKKSILEALSLELSDIVIINLATSAITTFKELQNRFHPEKLIFFGLSPAEIRWHIETEKYRLYSWSNCKVVVADSLELIADEVEKKKLLWNVLQEMFGMKGTNISRPSK